MIPATPGPQGVTSSERRVFDALAASDLSGTALHSLSVPEHRYKLMAEIDFLLVLEDLILAVEVKGGQIARHAGVWEYFDRAGHHRTSHEGPFRQVESGMFAVRTRLRRRNGPQADVAFGFLVVTPDVDLTDTFEWDAETYCGRAAFTRGIDRAVERARAYWLRKDPGHRPMDRQLRKALLNDLRPDFDYSPLLDARASQLELAMVRLTEEQYSRLDLISDEQRVICLGGAGTGKTFLATEVASRQARLGQRVLFLCRSGILAAHVTATLGAGVDVRTADQLGTDEPYDVVVIDEAQDLMTFDLLERIEAVIAGGWADGRWVMFMDHNRQAHLYGDHDPEALEYIRSFRPVTATLRANCRNTREITFHTRAYTGADVGVATAGSGPEVAYEAVTDRASETAALEAHLRFLREQGVAPEHITIVSMRGDWDTSCARDLREARRGRIDRLTPALAADWPGRNLTWASAVDIKGLENRFVCVVDIDEVDTDRHLDLLYVALTRPRAGLWIATSPAVRERLGQLFREHGLPAEAPGRTTP